MFRPAMLGIYLRTYEIFASSGEGEIVTHAFC